MSLGLFRGGAGVRAEAFLLCRNRSRVKAVEEEFRQEDEPTFIALR